MKPVMGRVTIEYDALQALIEVTWKVMQDLGRSDLLTFKK